jgi:hypothetical protein
MTEEKKSDVSAMLEELKAEWEKRRSDNGSTCPNCGYCRHCGRGGSWYPYKPPYTEPYRGPFWYTSAGATSSEAQLKDVCNHE